jgi:2-dehydro-3-deoxyphosphogluconate aldolase/(4S)-4-hydroxy-2-oxoglutarate aldolase
VPNLACVGGSWLTPSAALAAADYAAITTAAYATTTLAT